MWARHTQANPKHTRRRMHALVALLLGCEAQHASGEMLDHAPLHTSEYFDLVTLECMSRK